MCSERALGVVPCAVPNATQEARLYVVERRRGDTRPKEKAAPASRSQRPGAKAEVEAQEERRTGC